MIVGAEAEKKKPHDGTMSKLLKGLIKVSFIPINTDSNYRKWEFKLISKETLKFFTIWYGLHIAILVSLVMLFKDSIITAYYLEQKNNPIDLVAAGIFSFCLWWIFPMSPLFLGSTVAKIPSTVWKNGLHWPSCGNGTIFSAFLFILGSLIANISWVYRLLGFTQDTFHMIIIFLFAEFLVAVYWTIPILLILSLISKFYDDCNQSEHDPTSGVEIKLDMFSTLKKSLSRFFFAQFAVAQVFSIFACFLCFTKLMGKDEITVDRIIFSIGMVLIVLSLTFNIVGLALVADDAHAVLFSKIKLLQENLLQLTNMQEIQKVKNTIKDIERTGPFTGLGYFDITRETLTAMMSVSITYIIILVQFKMSTL